MRRWLRPIGVEACDDGNDNNQDECTNEVGLGAAAMVSFNRESSVTMAIATMMTPAVKPLNATCDGIVQTDVEVMMVTANTDACLNDCSLSRCGDGYVYFAQQCDDGNRNDLDACRNDCVQATCGDGITRSGIEECDDGNDIDGDGLVMQVAAMWRWHLRSRRACDDRNSINGDACLNDCIQHLGDGYPLPGEEATTVILTTKMAVPVVHM